jgi:hypothetical protein
VAVVAAVAIAIAVVIAAIVVNAVIAVIAVNARNAMPSAQSSLPHCQPWMRIRYAAPRSRAIRPRRVRIARLRTLRRSSTLRFAITVQRPGSNAVSKSSVPRSRSPSLRSRTK